MKSTTMRIERKLTAREAIKRMIVYRLGKHYNSHFYSAGVEYDESIDMWNFVAESFNISVKGYVGCLGQITVTAKDGETLAITEYEEI